jgi:arylsulfatase A-like enzyme
VKRICNTFGLVLVALYLTACTHRSPPNVIVVLIDTLRADRLDWYDGTRQLTPFLNALAARGDVFWNAYAQSSWTAPSVASLFTSRYPSQHAMNVYGSVLAESELTLAEILKQHGYATGGFSANTLVSEEWGYAQGFDRFEAFVEVDAHGQHDWWAKPKAERVNQAALAWLDTLAASGKPAQPVFLYLQYMEPHGPYFPPKESLDQVMARRPDRERAQGVLREIFVDPKRMRQPDADVWSVIRSLYDAEVLALDAKLRDLFRDLESRGWLGNAIVVITADHGEELADHGRMGHGFTLYNEVIHVPLMILTPERRRRTDIRDVVSLVDVAPTILDLAGMAAPPLFEGHSLESVMHREVGVGRLLGFLHGAFDGRGPLAQAAYSELLKKPTQGGRHVPVHIRALIVGSHKLIQGRNGETEVYDLHSDSGETNAHGLTAADQAALAQTLGAIGRLVSRNPAQEHIAPLDERTKERMRALGYAP